MSNELVVVLSDAQLEALAEKVAAKLSNGNGNGYPGTHSPEPDRLLTAGDAAQRLGVKPRWLYGHDLPFTVRLPNSRAVRFSERGIARWLARKMGQ